MSIEISDLVKAYRKVKVDIFYDTGHLTSKAFAEYEENLFENLENLHKKINGKGAKWFGEGYFIGTHHISLKKVDFRPKKKEDDKLEKKGNDMPFVFFSSSKRSWEDYKSVNPDFRIIGEHSVDFHILSSLWIEKVGLPLEKHISENSYGCRLKRPGQTSRRFISSDSSDESTDDATFLLGNFRPYLIDYQRWQYNGIQAIKTAIAADKKVVAVTADLKKYYHRIDCSFISSPEFLEFISQDAYGEDQKLLNHLLIKAISAWSKSVYNDTNVPDKFKYRGHAGVPMGLGASKVIANLLLTYLDRAIENEIKPIYYGRYVDDLFIVLEDGSTINSPERFWEYLEKRIDNLEKSTDDSEGKSETETKNGYKPKGRILKVPFSENSLLEFGKNKEKYFFLEGLSGETFLDTLKESMDENSSEWKFPPNTDDDLNSFSEEITKASSNHSEPANGLRKSDGVSVQRLKFILYLTRFEKAVELLPKKIWQKNLDKFFALAIEYTIRQESIAIFCKYYPRVVALAIKAKNFDVANEVVNRVKNTFENLIYLLKEKDPADQEVDLNKLCLERALDYQFKLIQEGVYSSIDPFSTSNDTNKLYEKLIATLGLSSETVNQIAHKLFNADLHRIPFKEVFISPIAPKEVYFNLKSISFYEDLLFDIEDLPNYTEFEKFSDLVLKEVLGLESEWFRPFGFYFYTRPFTLLDLTIMFPTWHSRSDVLKSFSKLFNWEWFNPEITQLNLNSVTHKVISVKAPERSIDRVIALTSLETKNISWTAVVREDGIEPDINREQRILNLVGDIIRCNLRCVANGLKGISYILFPELAIPRKMLLCIAGLLKKDNISLIAGIEYKYHSSDKFQLPKTITGFVSNQLIYILCVKTKSFVQQASIIQEKVLPAQKEEAELFSVGGKILQAQDETKFIIDHGGFFFSGLICNDLLNIENRTVLRGEVDALVVVEWNRDVDHYDSLVASASNDLHCFVLQVNNRLYGDTRLRGPYKESYDRDKIRVRGGELDYFVVATLEIKKLREFQRHHRSPATPFKPVPTGFRMSQRRKNKTS